MNLTVTDITDEGFNVTWLPSPDPDLQGYGVVVSTLDGVTAVNQSTYQSWLQVVGLTLETDYIIRVTVLVLSGGLWSQSNVTTTEATTIMSSSRELEFVNVTETTSMLRFTWEPPDAVVTGYRIMYGQEEATEQLHPSPGPGERSALIVALEPDTMYKVEIITIGRRRESLSLAGQNATEPDECATLNAFCDQICTNVPGSYRCFCQRGFVLMPDAHGCRAVEPPSDLSVSDITDKGFMITWSPDPDPDLQEYRVEVSKIDRTTAVNQNTEETSFQVLDLSPDSDYVIHVTSLFLTDGWPSQSDTTVIHTSTEMSSSTDLQFVEVTESMLRFTWEPPDAVVTGYRVMYGQEEATQQLHPSPDPADRSAVIRGLQARTMYKLEIITIGAHRQSEPLIGYEATGKYMTTTVSTDRTSLMTTFFISLLTSTIPAGTSETTSTRELLNLGGDQLDDDESEDDSLATTSTATTLDANREGIEQTSTISPVGSKTTPADQLQAPDNILESIYADAISPNPQDVLQRLAQNIADDPGGSVELEQPTSAAEEKSQNTALGVLKSITSQLNKLDMSDPSTIESVGGSLVESVATLLYEPEEDSEGDGGNLQSYPVEDDTVSPEERAQKAKQKEDEHRAEKESMVQKSHQVLDDLFNAITDPMMPGAPPVTLDSTSRGVTLRAQKIFGAKSGSQVVQTEDGGFQFPSQTALFPENPPHNITVKLTQYQQNPYTWGHGHYQARSSVMELTLHRKYYKPLVFKNLTQDFIITIPGKSANKPATKTITYPVPGNRSSSYHLLNLNNSAEAFLVTITPLNSSVVYGVSGRYGGRPDDQNYDVYMETYVLPEQCSLMETLLGDGHDTDKTKAKMFIRGTTDPADYYVKVQVRGPTTECDISNRTDEKNSHSNDFYSYRIEWARLTCVFWSMQEDWRTNGCTISDQSTFTSAICHCNHLTAFGSDFATPPDTVDFGLLTLRDLHDNGAVLTTIFVEFCLFLLALVITKVIDLRSTRKKTPSLKLDDLQSDFRYRLHIWTGAAKHAGTESTVAFNLLGDAANSGVRVVNIAQKVFTQNSQVTLTFSTAEQLGNVELLQLMHDDSGEGSRASWHVDRAAVQDLTTKRMAYFFCGEWLAGDRGDGQVVKTFPVASEEDLRSFGFLFPACLRSNLTEEHLFLSVAIMPEGSSFTRIERLGCCLSFLTVSMVSSAMWLTNGDETQVVQAINFGPFSFTLNTVYTGIMTSITCLPVVMAIVLLFQYSRPSNKGDRRVRDVETADSAEAPTQKRPAKGLPHWCKYVAWVLVVLSSLGSAVFTILYSLEWGKEKSERWLSMYFITFLADIVLLQPVKILVLAIIFSAIFQRHTMKLIFENEGETVSLASQKRTGFDCSRFRVKKKMERLSEVSLANVDGARKKRNRDRRIGDVIWDIIRSCARLLLALTIINAHHNINPAFYQTQSAADNFVQSIDEVTEPTGLWSWLNETAMEAFYPETTYNGAEPRWWEKVFTADRQSVLVAPPSLIQARVKSGLCSVPAAMPYMFDCTAAYDENTKETGVFQKGWKRVTNMSEVQSEAPGWSHRLSHYTIKPVFGVMSQYWGDGFSLDLGKSADEMSSILTDLKANEWIDKQTRAVLLEQIVYNGNLDMFTSVAVVFEFTEMYGVFTHRHLHTFRLHQQQGTIGYIYVLMEITYVIILLYSLWKEVKTARAGGTAYLKKPWNIFEIVNFLLAFTAIALYATNRAYGSKVLAASQQGKDQLQYLRSVVNINLIYGWLLSFLAFFNIMKLLRLLRFNPLLSKLMSVFRGMAVEFSAFILYFFLCFSGFGMSAYLMFGTTATTYRSISSSFSTLFQMSLGLFDYTELWEANPILGPIFFITFICFMFLVLMNIAMAIIDTALPDVRDHVMAEEDRLLLEGLWERFTSLFGLHQVPVTDVDTVDRLHDSLIEVEIQVERLWLKRQSLFNCRIKNADLPAEPDFVPPVTNVFEDAAEKSQAPGGDLPVIVIRPASHTNRAVSGSEKNTPAEAAASPSDRYEEGNSTEDKESVSRASQFSTAADKQQEAIVSEVGNLEKVDMPSSNKGDESVEGNVAQPLAQMLTYNQIQAAQSLLRCQYPALQGLEDPSISLYEDLGFAKMIKKGLQIHHSGNMHWVLSSYTDGQVCLYDNLGVAMTTSLQVQLCQSYAAFADSETNVLAVQLPEVQHQWNDNDSGLFAIAWAVDIAEGRDVRMVVYDDKKMSSHLEMCFKEGKLTPFPRLTSLRKKVGPNNAHQISLVCHCEQVGRLGRMERCKACRRIFHVSCLGASPPRGGTWACGDCTV
ncbi:PREDICTED: polycystic kidney disease protein 1-like 2 [Branchiostoma belcheri]|uniref:Polycystic kidney disease protein 1-like 2 n=1 Tax=Branchiostoma belcheri TaxID=7741 RepID=A0A6P4ZA24_BRABE|nr:PREDICTED: polycystic kidney disease protein 1-like 2 [Branchiostoma belcheri]